MARLTLSFLGTFLVTLDERLLTHFRSDKVKSLLAYLAIEAGQPHLRTKLSTLFWPDEPDSVARQNLRQSLYQLRQLLGEQVDQSPPFLRITRDTVQWNPAAAATLDVTAFLTHLEQHELAEAVALYRGDLLMGLTCGSVPFEEWLLFTRERYHHLALDALFELTEEALVGADYARARTYAQRQLALEPWREEAHRQLMLALACSGERSAALAHYEVCCRVLETELGVTPARETVALYEQIRTGTLDVPMQTSSQPAVSVQMQATAGRSLRHNLPAQPTPFIGRKQDLALIGDRLDDPTCRLLTIVGPGGMGKTRLALQAAQSILDFGFWISDSAMPDNPPKSKVQNPKFEDGLFFVSLAGVTAADRLVSTITSVLELTFHGGADSKTQLLDYLKPCSLLLVLDNCEHLLDGIDLVSDLLAAAPNVKVLATSREPLNLREEWLHPLASMSYPSNKTEAGAAATSVLAQYTAVQLFVQRARQMRPAFDWAAEQEHVLCICRLVEGMPLGIELAAAWLKLFPCEQIARKIAEDLGFLATSLRNIPARHRSMRAVFEHSWSLLTGEEKQVFSTLAVFRGGFVQEAAEQIAGASFSILIALVEKSLLQSIPGERFQMHELLRQFAEEKLYTNANLYVQVQGRHSSYYCAWVHGLELALQTAAAESTLAAIEVELENIRTAWLWAEKEKQIASLTQAVEAFLNFHYRRNRLGEGIRLCQATEQRLVGSATADGQYLVTRLLIWHGRLLVVGGKHEQARPLLEESLALLEQLAATAMEVRRDKGAVLLLLGHLTHLSDLQSTRRFYSEALAIYRTVGDRWLISSALAALAAVRLDLGETEVALQLARECLVLRRELGAVYTIIQSLNDLGGYMLLTGEFEQGEALAQEAQALCIRNDDQLQLAYTLDYLGQFAAARSDYRQAIAYFDQSIALLVALDRRQETAQILYQCALAHLSLGDLTALQADVEEGLSLLSHNPRQEMVASLTFVEGCRQIAQQRHGEAWQTLHTAGQLFHELGQPRGAAQTVAMLSYLAHQREQASLAQAYALMTLRAALALRIFLPVSLVLPTVALLLLELGEVEQAVEVYALAQRQPYVHRSPFFAELAGETMEQALALLPPAAIVAAKARGQACDLWQVAQTLATELPTRGWSESTPEAEAWLQFVSAWAAKGRPVRQASEQLTAV
jgi:predicted ATPase/DNA-binding SARP family transcriptional activator